MELPNPYNGDYKKLVAIPIFLALLSLVLFTFVQPIRFGIDFKGGIEAELPVPEPLNLDTFSQTLTDAGYQINTLEQNQRPGDYIIQAELTRPQKVIDADEIKQRYFELRTNVSELEAQTIYNANDTEIKANTISKKKN